MEPVYLNQTNKVAALRGNTSDDVNAPFSFIEWKERSRTVSERDINYLYNSYVINWFNRNKDKPVSQKFILRQKYLYMLDQLQLFFTDEEKDTWFKQVNLADEKELLLAIPYFARKLKDIALYYLKLRKQLKNTKLKYNTIGTAYGIEQQIYNYILDAFSATSKELSPSVYSTVPSFSSLQEKLAVHVEELYDDKQYFDLSPTVPISAYFNLGDIVTSNFLATKGIILSSSEWLFESFNIPVSTSFESVFSTLTGNIFETSDSELFGSFIQKYIGQTKNSTAFTAELSTTTVTNIDIALGNNYFYYPYGTVDPTISSPKQISVIALSSLQFDTFVGTDGISSPQAGSTLEDSDVIFVKTGNITKSAWLRYQKYEEYSKTIKASIKKDSTTSFIYPFPGYGLSANNLPWTGASFESTSEYNFLPRDIKNQVTNAYWNQTLPLDTCNSLLLNNSTFAENGATANAHPQYADQVFIRTDRGTDSTVPYGEANGAWLYKFTKTALPVSLTEDNVFLWPYCTVDATVSPYPDHLNAISFTDVCNPVNVQQLPKSSFIAASSFDLADKIYKLNAYTDTELQAIECVWLSGATIDTENYSYIQQDGFSALFSAGEAARFIWTGPETTLDEAFIGVAHRGDCPFVTNSPKISALEWQKCTCKQVYHSPFGHSYKTFEEGNNFADCIAIDSSHTLDPFDFSSWRDSEGKQFINSAQFAWYKTSSKTGWGDGKWTSNVTVEAPFRLIPGKAYFYRRANDRIAVEPMPPYTVNHSFGTSNTKWIPAKKLAEGEWGEAGSTGTTIESLSSMIIHAGDFIKISRQAQTTSYLLSSYQVLNTDSNSKSVWSTYDRIPVVCGQTGSTLISWPDRFDPFENSEQYPPVTSSQLSSIYGWTITRDQDGESHTIYGLQSVTFVPPTTGTYSISVTANVAAPLLSSISCTSVTSAAGLAFARANDFDQNVSMFFSSASTVEIFFNPSALPPTQPLVISNIIPKISAIEAYTIEYVKYDFTTPSSGFLLEYSLKGWNYNTSKPDKKANGAKPYWATLDTEKDSTTRYKGLYSWGYNDSYVDEYIPNNAPIISPIQFNYGTVIEYFRKGYSFAWVQPITYSQYVNSTQWCQISADTTKSSNLSGLYAAKRKVDPVVIATTNPTDIRLSNILNGSPVEVYYYALNSFVWPVSVTVKQNVEVPAPSAYFVSQTPWENLQNRFYPTIANVPVLEQTYSVDDVGGYFVPQNLGASIFINKDFDVTVKQSDLSGNFLTEDTTTNVGGRGRTKQDQSTIYTWSENNQWLKESITTGDLAGAIKRNLTKTLQTFIPYQSNSDETALGLLTNRSRISPWGGYRDEEWTDKLNEPKSFTGVRNVSAWAVSQVIKQTDKPVDCWSSDIFGNQYAVFKSTDNVSVGDRSVIGGEIWTRINSQIVQPGYVSLSAVFEPFIFDSTIYKELTGNGVKSFEVYYDTLFIETNSIVLYAPITYNYNTSLIEHVFDDSRWMYLNSGKLRFEKNWFFPTEKTIVSLYTEINGKTFSPSLYQLEISGKKFKKIFPSDPVNIANLAAGLSGITFNSVTKGSLHYNATQDAYLVTYIGTDAADTPIIVDFYLKDEEILNLTKINVYKDLFDANKITEPPIVLAPYLSVINATNSQITSLEIPIRAENVFYIPIVAENNPTLVQTHTTQMTAITAVNGWAFVGSLSGGLYHINYDISNDVGSVTYSLSLSVYNSNV